MESVFYIVIGNHGYRGILEEIKWDNAKNEEKLRNWILG